jgi:hypothetical protein
LFQRSCCRYYPAVLNLHHTVISVFPNAKAALALAFLIPKYISISICSNIPVFHKAPGPVFVNVYGAQGIDSEESIPSAYVVWRADATNRIVVPAYQAGNRFLGAP